ncbi:MAG: lytic transglycosylase domain-containing protein [Acidobacteriota bacterium]
MGHSCHGHAAPRLAAMAVMVVCALLLSPSQAEAQIYVVVEPDGNRRYTTQPEPEADVYVPTPFSRRAGAAAAPTGDFDGEIVAAAGRAGLDPALVRAVVASESAFDPRALSHKGAQGLMQLMPKTARELGVENVWDPRDNLDGGTRYLARLLGKYDDLGLALAAYNAGEGAVERHGGVPPFPETQHYVRRVIGLYRTYRSSGR